MNSVCSLVKKKDGSFLQWSQHKKSILDVAQFIGHLTIQFIQNQIHLVISRLSFFWLSVYMSIHILCSFRLNLVHDYSWIVLKVLCMMVQCFFIISNLCLHALQNIKSTLSFFSGWGKGPTCNPYTVSSQHPSKSGPKY